jgi:sulfate transport system ATP-binding protein/LacI family transcriptional regulator/LacI family repressor for deo operon, udp, cdd, tsx, nupC, and nupG
MSIKQIAQMTGTSVATVSRVLNDPEYKCRQTGLREKIWDAAMELDYVPNEAARSLRAGTGKTASHRQVLVLMTHTAQEAADPFFTELLKNVESQIHRQGMILSGVTYLPQLSEEESTDRLLRDTIENLSGQGAKKPDGLIVIGKCRKEAFSLLVKRYANIVAINRNSVEFAVDEVTCDGSRLATIATEHLIGLGHTKIAYAGETGHESRLQGFRQTLAAHGIPFPDAFLLPASHTAAEGMRLMEALLRRKERPDAIFCANDCLAIGMLRCLAAKRNYQYSPSIIGCDDIEEAQFTEPMLSSVHVPKEEMGYLAVLLLGDRLTGGHKAASKLELLGHLMQRNSTRPPQKA